MHTFDAGGQLADTGAPIASGSLWHATVTTNRAIRRSSRGCALARKLLS
jgi:hypothetical protein